MSVLVIGQNRWGHGESLSEAKKFFQEQGGKLSLGYVIAEFGEGSEFGGVNFVGDVYWKGHEPVVREVKARKGAKR
jgi:hypothetical protein